MVAILWHNPQLFAESAKIATTAVNVIAPPPEAAAPPAPEPAAPLPAAAALAPALPDVADEPALPDADEPALPDADEPAVPPTVVLVDEPPEPPALAGRPAVAVLPLAPLDVAPLPAAVVGMLGVVAPEPAAVVGAPDIASPLLLEQAPNSANSEADTITRSPATFAFIPISRFVSFIARLPLASKHPSVDVRVRRAS
jgi:hypothetical protein